METRADQIESLRAELQRAVAEGAEWKKRYEEAMQLTGQLLYERNAQMQLAAVVESSGDAILSLALDGSILSWNPGAERLYGYTAAESIGQPVALLAPPARQEEMARRLERLGQGGRVEAAETVQQRKDGSRVEVALTISPVRNASGQVIAASLIARDITARKRAEAALRRSEAAERAQREFFQVTLASIGDAVIVTNPQGEVTFFNRVAEAVTGWTTAEAAGKLLPEVFRVVNEETGQLVANPVERVLRTGRIVGLVNHTALIRKDGGVCPIDDSAAPIYDEQGRLLGIIIVFRDITERRKAESAQRESAARLRAIVNTAVDGIITIDERGILEWLNPAAERLFGYTARELVGQNIKVLMPAPYRDEHDGYLASYLRTGEAKIIGIGREVVGQRRDGTTFPMELAVSEVRLPDRRLFTGLVRDISARKEAEEAQAQLLAEVQRANEELQQFAYIVSHDLNEPLRTVANFVSLLAKRYRGKLDANAEEYIAFAVDGTRRMQQMIQALLAYTRLGGQESAFTAVNCETLLARVLADLQMAITESRAVVTHDPLPTVSGDATQLAGLAKPDR